MACPETSFKARLQSIIAAAENLKLPAYTALCKAGKTPSQNLGRTHTASEVVTIPSPLLPLPSDIQPALVEVGCSLEVAHSLSDAFMRSAHQIRAMYQSTHAQTCKSLTDQMASEPSRLSERLQRIRSAFERQYEARIRAAEHLAIDHASNLQQTRHSSRSKASFNQEFVPLLEKYFEYNAYPSAPDRAALARKSMMTPRQIEVWFQNHRNRSKKDGLPLRRLTSDPLPLKLSFESLEQKMPFFIIPESERKDQRTDPSKINASDQDGQTFQRTSYQTAEFNLAPPPHAFPTVYPPSCDNNPFPPRDGEFKFAIPTWKRKPATSHPPYTPLNIDDLITDFASKLVIRGPPYTDQRRKAVAAPCSVSGYPWFTATHTIVSPAPHPALLRSSLNSNPNIVSAPYHRLPAVIAPAVRQQPFRSPSPFSHPTTMLTSMGGGTPTPRKMARLPRRAPKSASLAHRRTSPAMSDAPSPSRSLSSSSRSSSFTSDTSFNGRSSLSSSTSSTSSTVTTPASSPITLPDSPSLTTNNYEEEIFGTTSPVKTLPLKFLLMPSFSSKHIHGFTHIAHYIQNPLYPS